MNPMILSVLIVGGSGLLISILLSVAGKKFEVVEDERIGQVREALPGSNCGGCGFPGCDGCAAAIVAGKAPVNACPVGGAAVAKVVAGVMGETVSDEGRKVAFVHCGGDCNKAKTDYVYTGLQDCSMMAFVPDGGPKVCEFGCLGFGSCAKACKFGVITVSNGIAKVDKELCKGCGACTKVCPNHLIEMVPYDGSPIHVVCSSKEKGKVAMQSCDAACISCKKCEKNCPSEAIHLVDNIPVIDYDKCTSCGLCKDNCPKGCIISW